MNTLKPIPIPAFADNYIWLAANEHGAMCVDPGDAVPVMAWLDEHRLPLQQIWLTHHHNDHIGGVADLKAAYPEVRVYGATNEIAEVTDPVAEGSRLAFGGHTAEVWAVPGHTAGHLAYLWHLPQGLQVFCGDTLFSAGCGRVFTGTPQQLFASLGRLSALPDDSLFYPAHEYTAANLRFAAYIEPDNADVIRAQADTRIPTLPVSLRHEKAVNPFLRTALPQVQARVAELAGGGLAGEVEVFRAMRELKNHF